MSPCHAAAFSIQARQRSRIHLPRPGEWLLQNEWALGLRLRSVERVGHTELRGRATAGDRDSPLGPEVFRRYTHGLARSFRAALQPLADTKQGP
jgi:hypothetical protein